MMTLRGAVTQLLMRRYASGDLPVRLAAWVREGIEDDAALTEAYTKLRRAERLAAGGAGLSAAQEDLLELAVLAAVERDEPAPAKHAAWKLSRLAPFMASAACVALFVVAGERERDGGFGAADLEARGAELARAPLGVKVSCVLDKRVVDSATVGVRRPSDVLTCKDDGLLAYALTNLSDDARYVFVLGVSPAGEPRWYAPFEKKSSAFRIEAGRSNDVLPILGDMRGMTDDARVSLFVLLSDRPFAAADVERQLDAARARGAQLAGIERLPLSDVPVQARVEMARR